MLLCSNEKKRDNNLNIQGETARICKDLWQTLTALPAVWNWYISIFTPAFEYFYVSRKQESHSYFPTLTLFWWKSEKHIFKHSYPENRAPSTILHLLDGFAEPAS
jgi:hypothetical protein